MKNRMKATHLVVCDDDNGLACVVPLLNVVESLADRLESSAFVLRILNFATCNAGWDLGHELFEIFVVIRQHQKA